MEITIDLIQDTIWQLRKNSAQHADKQRKYLKFDGAFCYPEIRSHLKALEMVRNQILADALCICPAEVSLIYYGAKKYLGHLCADPEPDYVKEDRPDKTRWVLENPDCVLYDYWVDYVKAQCKKIGLNLEVKVKECASVGIDVRVAYEEACDEVLLNFRVEEIKCDFGIDITVEEMKSCKADYDFYVKPLNCDISLDTFVRAVSCGVSVDTLVREVNCGASLVFTAEGAEFCYPNEEGEATIIPLSFDVAVDDSTVCYYTNMEFSLENVSHLDANYAWDFGAGSVPGTASGAGPHTVYYETAGSKTVTVTGTVNDQVVVHSKGVTISSCPGNITGSVFSSVGTPIAGTNVRLYADTDLDGMPDNATAIRSVFCNSGGGFSMATLIPGNYVIQVISPTNYTILSGIDGSEDNDLVVNVNTGDVYLPVTITGSELDQNNDFVYTPNPGTISGTVVDDLGAPIEGATIEIYRDDNMDGVSDGVLEGSGVTDALGGYSISGLFVGYDISSGGPRSHYVIVLTVPDGYSIVSGIDPSIDADVVPNTVTTDNIIPSTLTQGEVDANNNFVIELTP